MDWFCPVIDAPKASKLAARPASVEPEVLKQMLSYHETELAKMTDQPEELDAADKKVPEQLEEVQSPNEMYAVGTKPTSQLLLFPALSKQFVKEPYGWIRRKFTPKCQ